MQSLNSSNKASSSKRYQASSSQERNLVSSFDRKVVRDMNKKEVQEEENKEGNEENYLLKAFKNIEVCIEGIDIEIDEIKKKKEEFEDMNLFFDSLKKEDIFSSELFRKYEYVLALEEKINQSLPIQLKLRDISQKQKEMIEQMRDHFIALEMNDVRMVMEVAAYFQNKSDNLQREKIPLLHEYIRFFARGYEQSFSLQKSLERYLKHCSKGHVPIVRKYKEVYNIYREYILNLNAAIANTTISALEKYNMLISDCKGERFPPLWDRDVPEITIDIFALKKLQESIHISDLMQPLEILKRRNLEIIKNRIQSLEEQASQRANDMMNLLLQEDAEEKREKPQELSVLSSVSPSSKNKIIPKIQQDDSEVSRNIVETGTSSKPSPEEQYNQKLYEKWENYLKPTEYREGYWHGKGGISIPLMKDYFPSQMQFRLSIKEVIKHLEKRHPEFVQDLSEVKKQDIKDNDGFKVIMSKYNSEIHNLIFELSSQLSHEDTIMYKSKFHTDGTGTKIKNPTIMIRGKDKEGKMLLSAWGLYGAEKGSAIKLHLLSCYVEDNQNRTLPKNAMKISGLAEKLHEEIETEANRPLEDAELIALFADGASLQTTKAQKKFEQIKKSKGKNKK